MSTLDFIPKLTPLEIGKFSDEPWLSFEEPTVVLCQGMRGSGKGVVVDSIVEKLYNQGFNIWHLWGARSLENLYYVVNKNCKEKYAKLKTIIDAFFEQNFLSLKTRCACKGLRGKELEKYIQTAIDIGLIKNVGSKYKVTEDGIKLHLNKFLHCKCHKTYPVLWIVPDYIEFDQESLDRFNGVYWKDFDEFKEHLNEITSEEKRLLFEGKLKKPEDLRPKSMIVIGKITPPTTSQRKDVFREEFTKIVLQARDERRIVVMNPAVFEGAVDKFDTITEIFRMISYLMNTSGHFSPLTENQVGKPIKYWTKKQLSWHKVAIILNELRSIAPSSNLSGEKDAGKSKKAIFDYIPEARHYRTWFIGDYQRPDDVYPTIRYNANVVVVKNGSRNILGDDWNWLFTSIENQQMKFASKLLRREIKNIDYLKNLKNKKPKLKQILDTRPMVDELKANQGYVTFPNNEYVKEKFTLPSFHHKQSNEMFRLDTGIKWSVNMKKKPEEPKTLTKSEKKKSIQQKKEIKKDIMRRMEFWRETEKKPWDVIQEELVQLQVDGIIPQMEFEEKTPIYFSNWYGTWKKKMA